MTSYESDVPTFSIILPVYNARSTLPDTLRSILWQSLEDWECIIIDDCSGDGSWELANEAAHSDPRIRTVRNKKNAGAGTSRNLGLDVARGRFVAFLDSDDFWLPFHLAQLKAVLEETGVDVAYVPMFSLNLHTNRGVLRTGPRRVSFRALLLTCFLPCSGSAFRRDILGQTRMPEIRARQDYGFWLLLLRSGRRARRAPIPSLIYRTGRATSISSTKAMLVRYNYRVFHEVLGFGRIGSLLGLGSNVLFSILAPYRRRRLSDLEVNALRRLAKLEKAE